MAKYIPLDAVVAEIEKFEKEASERLTRPVERSMRRVTKDKTIVGLCRKILDVIDTLEVKEVDLNNKGEWKNTGGFGSIWDPDSPDYYPD